MDHTSQDGKGVDRAVGVPMWLRGRSKLIGFVVTVVFLVLAIRNVDLSAVAAELAAADYRFLAPAAACTLAGYLFRTLRWQIILRPVQHVPWRTLFSVLMLGFATNNIVPARVGEIVRAYTLGRKVGISATLSLATIVVERVFDGLTLLLLMALALRIAPVLLDNDYLRVVEVASVVIFATALVILVLLLTLQSRALALLARLLRPLPTRLSTHVSTMAESFILGLRCLRHPTILAQMAATSLLVWTAEAASYAFIARAFDLGLGPRQYFGAVLFLLVFVNLGIMIPSAPGYIGTFQFFARLALAAFAVPAERAIGLAILSHTMQYTLVTGFGLVILWREHLSLTRIVSAPATLDPAAD
jgi:uncharacterized protein (TIRG00374 family)